MEVMADRRKWRHGRILHAKVASQRVLPASLSNPTFRSTRIWWASSQLLSFRVSFRVVALLLKYQCFSLADIRSSIATICLCYMLLSPSAGRMRL